MAIVIEDEETVQRVERLAAGLCVDPLAFVRAAVDEKCATLEKGLGVVTPEVFERRLRAIRQAQEWFRDYGNPDPRSADEIVGYNEFGHFD